MKDLGEENFDDSDSENEDEFENSIFENNEVDFDQKIESLFAWKELEDSEVIHVLTFSSKVGLKVDASNFKSENDFFKLMFTDEILAVLVEETNNLKERDSPTYNRLWKIRKIFDYCNRIFKDVYDPTENLSFDEAKIKFKRRVFFKQYSPKKCKQWGLKMYKIADATGYTYDMRVYLGKDRNENLSTSVSYNVVYTMADCIKGKGHKVFMDNFFTLPELFETF
ncbi:piggyBac transposable element-derived protein 4 [Trichonephila clavipes]|nr:piggyBac transposable element-derived protein 4 [Trichonephila clavipes]